MRDKRFKDSNELFRISLTTFVTTQEQSVNTYTY